MKLIIVLMLLGLVVFSIYLIQENLIFDKTDENNNLLDTNNLTVNYFPDENNISESTSETIDNVDSGSQKNNLDILEPSNENKSEWRVMLPDGIPAPGAKLTLIKFNEEIYNEFLHCEDHHKYSFEMHEAFANGKGVFDFQGVDAGQYLLHAQLKDYASAHCEVDLRYEWPDKLEIKLARSRVIQGKVVDIENKPLNDVLLDISLPYGDISSMSMADVINLCRFNKVVKTDENGLFKVLDQPKKMMSITIYDDPVLGYAGMIRAVNSFETDEILIVLRKSCCIEGKVFDSNKKPVKGAWLWNCIYENANMEFKGIDAPTDENGYFKFESVKEGQSYLTVRHENYGNTVYSVNAQRLKKNWCEIELPDGVSAEIIIQDHKEKPLEGIDVIVSDTITGAQLVCGVTDKNGKIEVHSLIPGNLIQVNANCEDIAKDYDSVIQIFDPAEQIIITLERFTWVCLNIFDKETGFSIDEFSAAVLPHKSRFYESGIVENMSYSNCKGGKTRCRLREKEPYNYLIAAEGYLPHSETIYFDEYSEGDIIDNVYLEKGLTYTGKIVNALNNKPICNATVELVRTSVKTGLPLLLSYPFHCVHTNSEGYFKIDSLPESPFTLKASADGYSNKYIDSNLLIPGIDLAENIIYLMPSASITGRVLLSSGLPVTSGIVCAYDQLGMLLKSVKINPVGEYFLQDIPAGVIELHVADYALYDIHHFRSYHIQKVELDNGQTAQVDFIIDGESVVIGSCTLNDTAVIGIEVYLLEKETRKIRSMAASSTDGMFFFKPVPEGQYILSTSLFLDGSGGNIQKEIDVGIDDLVEVEFNFDQIGLKGEVKDHQGKPIRGCWFTLRGGEGQGLFEGFTDVKGNYSIYHLPPGPYEVQVVAHGFGEDSFDINIKEDVVSKRDIVLKPEAILKLRVKPKGSGGLQKVFANIIHPREYSGKVASDYQGLFVFKNIAEGKVSVIVGGGGYAPSIISTNIVAGETVEKDLTLTKGGTLDLRVTTVQGSPISGARVAFQWQGLIGLSWDNLIKKGFVQAEPSIFKTDKKGRFKIGPLPPGTYPIAVSYGNLYWNGEAEITHESTKTLKVLL